MEKKIGDYWGAVRKAEDDTKEFVLSGEIGCTEFEAKIKQAATDREIPGWSRANPVQRIARLEVIEVKP